MNISLGRKYYGLDIGSSSVKLAEITLAGNRLSLTRLEERALPPEPLSEPEARQAVSGALRIFCKDQRFCGLRAAANLSGAYVASRRFTLPAMSHPELIAHIREHAADYLPARVNLSEVEFDYQVLREELREGQELVQIILAAGRREAIGGLLETMDKGGMFPACVDASGMSLFNTFALHPLVAGGGLAAIVDIGRRLTNVVVVRDQIITFVTEISAGAGSMAQALSEKYGMEPSQAETLLSKLPKPDETVEAVELDGNEYPVSVVLETIGPAVETLAEEIARVQRYLKADKAWQGTILVGGAAGAPGLREAVSKTLGCPVLIPETIEGLAVAPELAAKIPRFSLAAGLALKQVQEGMNSINLMPAEAREEVRDRFITHRINKMAKYAGAAMACAVILLAIAWGGFRLAGNAQKKAWAAIDVEWRNAREVGDVNRKLASGAAAIKALPGEMDASRVMTELARVLPQGAWLTSVRAQTKMEAGEGGERIVTGMTVTLKGNAGSEDQVVKLIRALEGSEVFTSPELKTVENPAAKASEPVSPLEGGVKFEIQCRFK